MRYVRSAAVAGLALASACGTATTARPVGSAPADPPATHAAPTAHYLGAVTQPMAWAEGMHLAPPTPGAVAKASWQDTYAAVCRPTACAGRPAPEIRLARVSSEFRGAHGSQGSLHGQLMYVFTWNNDQCAPAYGGPDRTARPVIRDCQTNEYLDANTGHWVSTSSGPMPATQPTAYRAPTAAYTSATAVRHDGMATVAAPNGDPLVSWESVWRSFCPPDGSPTKSSQGGTCVSGSTGTIELATVTLYDTRTPAPKLMYVVTWTKADCESLGGGAGQTAAPPPQPHPCTLRSYVDARTGHDEYDEDAQ